MTKQAIKLSRLIEIVNQHNRMSKGDPAIRRGVNGLLCAVLHECGAYAGFGYLGAEDVPAGEKPGIIRGDDVTPHQYPDETRVFYYQSHRLRS